MADFEIIRQPTATWEFENPTLLANQIGVCSDIRDNVETDTKLVKLGNGVDDWETLPYFIPVNIDMGVLTTSTPVIDASMTFNNSSEDFVAINLDITNTDSGTATILLATVDGVAVMTLDADGQITIATDTVSSALSASSVGFQGVATSAVLDNAATLTLSQGTIIADATYLDHTATWNNGTETFTGISSNITNTASAAASTLMNLAVGGTSRIKVPVVGAVGLSFGAEVASASAIVPSGNIFHVTGTTSITSITATNVPAGATITIIFDDVLTFTDGNNLKLAGNFTTSADDTITLVFDGTNFYEVARSVN